MLIYLNIIRGCNVGYFIFIIGVVIFLGKYWYDMHSKNILSIEYGYYYETVRNVIYYIAEIMMMFGLFLVFIDNPIYKLNYADSETSYLKQFIDFYTFYQIFIIVIFKLINSQFIAECRSLLDLLEMIKLDVESGNSGDSLIDIESIGEERRPYEINVSYIEIKTHIDHYFERVQEGADSEDEKRKLMIYLEREKTLVNMLINFKENEWQMSLIMRVLALNNKLSSYH